MTPPTVVVATIWSAPLLVAVLGLTTICATPLALVTAVVASNALRPNAELTLTTMPAPTGAPAPSFTVNVRVAGAVAVTLVLLAAIVSVGVSATS